MYFTCKDDTDFLGVELQTLTLFCANRTNSLWNQEYTICYTKWVYLVYCQAEERDAQFFYINHGN